MTNQKVFTSALRAALRNGQVNPKPLRGEDYSETVEGLSRCFKVDPELIWRCMWAHHDSLRYGPKRRMGAYLQEMEKIAKEWNLTMSVNRVALPSLRRC